MSTVFKVWVDDSQEPLHVSEDLQEAFKLYIDTRDSLTESHIVLAEYIEGKLVYEYDGTISNIDEDAIIDFVTNKMVDDITKPINSLLEDLKKNFEMTYLTGKNRNRNENDSIDVGIMPMPEVNFQSVALLSINESDGTINIPLTLSGEIGVLGGSIGFRIILGTTTSDDIGPITGTIPIPVGSTGPVNISINVVEDLITEGSTPETFSIVLENPVNCIIGPQSIREANIVDNDMAPPASSPQIYPQYPTMGTVELTVHPSPDTPIGVPSVVKVGIPMPPGAASIGSSTNMRIRDGATELPADISENINWQNVAGNTLYSASVRSVIVYFEYTIPNTNSFTLLFEYGGPAQANFLNYAGTDAALMVNGSRAPLAGDNTNTELMFPASFTVDGVTTSIQEPRTWVTLPAQWMCDCRLRSAHEPFGKFDSDPFWQDFDANAPEFLDSMVNDFYDDPKQPISASSYMTYLLNPGTTDNVEGWLYERDVNLWLGYIRTGDLNRLIYAYRNSEYFAAHLRDAGANLPGSFVGQPPADSGFVDRKYVTSGGMLINMMLTGNDYTSKIEQVANRQAGYITNTSYDLNTPFTERNAAYCLAGLLVKFELDGDASRLAEAHQVFNNLYLRQTQPEVYVDPSLVYNGGQLHSLRRHESSNPSNYVNCNGQAQDEETVSPFMSVMLCHFIWRYFMITGNNDALRYLSNYADWYAAEGTFTASQTPDEYPLAAGFEISFYLSGPCMQQTSAVPQHLTTATSDDVEAGVEHIPECLNLLILGKRCKELLGLTASQAIEDLIANHKQYIPLHWDHFTEEGTAGRSSWRVKPDRKANWWLVNSSEMSWADQTDISAQNGMFNFTSPQFIVRQGQSDRVWVARQGGSEGAVGCTVTLNFGTADASDFTGPTTFNLDWIDGDSEPKDFQLPAIADADVGYETASVIITAVSGGASIGTINPSADIFVEGN